MRLVGRAVGSAALVVAGILAFAASEHLFAQESAPEFVIGRHSGSESVLQVLSRLGVTTTRSVATQMLPEIRRRSVLKKSSLSDEELIQVLLARGADVNATNNAGFSPALMAATGGHQQAVERLLAAGADLNTCLFGAAGSGHLEIVRSLVERGANPNTVVIGGKTSLMVAEANRDRPSGRLDETDRKAEIVKFLKGHGQ